MSKKDGGPAFPRAGHYASPEETSSADYDNTPQDGMTLWDWYAGKAIDRAWERGMCDTDAARIAADMATAMLAERERRGIGKVAG